MASSSVAVIDIGSNSIKILVAAPGPGGRIAALQMSTIEARISAGISRENPSLGEEGMARGVAAVQSLLSGAEAFAPASVILVATSAVRGAANGSAFRERVRSATGRDIRILSGEEEANLIGRGLLCDPALAHLRDFSVFDLGGGSLECLAFSNRAIARAASLPLGCVRLTERFVADPAAPFDLAAAGEIAALVRRELSGAGVAVASPAAVVGTGGTLTTARKILAARAGVALEERDARIGVPALREMMISLGGLSLADRRKTPGLPPERADVLPAALVTLVALADICGFDAYQHSLYNLRWGLAAEALS